MLEVTDRMARNGQSPSGAQLPWTWRPARGIGSSGWGPASPLLAAQTPRRWQQEPQAVAISAGACWSPCSRGTHAHWPAKLARPDLRVSGFTAQRRPEKDWGPNGLQLWRKWHPEVLTSCDSSLRTRWQNKIHPPGPQVSRQQNKKAGSCSGPCLPPAPPEGGVGQQRQAVITTACRKVFPSLSSEVFRS